ncbi:MAG: hypothetical protein ACQGVC_22280 [Myxococcota bacterium]
MLPFLAVLLFAIFGIAALVVDAGLAFAMQARLESSTRTLAVEHERYRIDAAADPNLPAGEWQRRRQVVEADLLGPDASNVVWSGIGRRSRSESRIAPRFTFGALLPTTLQSDGSVHGELSVTELLRERAAHGPNAQITSGGLRAEGFRPQATVQLGDRPAVRVGAALPAAGLPGLARVALMDSSLPQALGAGPAPPPLMVAGSEVRLDDGVTCVGFTIDAAQGGSIGSVPRRVDTGFTQLSELQVDPEQAYVALLRGTCASPEPDIVAFLDLRLGDDGRSLAPSRVVSRRNASVVPVPGTRTAALAGLPDCETFPRLLCLAGFSEVTP